MENLMLKETINRLRSDLDELRTMSAAGGSGSNTLSRAGSGRPDSMLSVGPDGGTMGRSLEKELLKQLQGQKPGSGSGSTSEAGEDEDEGEEREVGEDESYVETFITRRRRRVSPVVLLGSHLAIADKGVDLRVSFFPGDWHASESARGGPH